ncbi:MAG: type I glutamate--ammonia ligase [Saccharofermentanales bacterium]
MMSERFCINNKLLYVLQKEKHSVEIIRSELVSHPEVKFVSLMGIDLAGNDTDERIPVSLFLDNIDEFLNGAIQTDGSSVVLPGIATLNDGKIDFIADLSVNWFIDYNYENFCSSTNLPVGTLRIPCFLEHNGDQVCSRSVLKRAVEHFHIEMMELLKKYPDICKRWGISLEDIDQISLTAATELEFWVRTPDNKIVVEQLSVSQGMKEQYWKRTRGVVKTALEQSIELLSRYNFNPEMGHKEVGGVKADIKDSGNLSNIMEQLEVDWKYSTALQAADNELFARIFIKEVFRLHGLEATFMAKPVEGVAGSGEHIHVNAMARLKNGKNINLFSPVDFDSEFLSDIGWGAIMGILKHYNVLGSFITVTNDAFNRLKPGFEAPTHAVASLGKNVSTVSRNRTVLLGLIRNQASPLATRFEIRSPNPHTNVYVCLGAIYQCVLNGIEYSLGSRKSNKELEAEFCKKPGDDAGYLEKERMYRTEEDVFKKYTEDERNKMFGTPPFTVFETLSRLSSNNEGKKILTKSNVFTERILESYSKAMRRMWKMELSDRILPKNLELVRSCTRLHVPDNIVFSIDDSRWQEIEFLRQELAKDTFEHVSIFTQIRNAIDCRDYSLVSDLQKLMSQRISDLEKIYAEYRRNIL